MFWAEWLAAWIRSLRYKKMEVNKLPEWREIPRAPRVSDLLQEIRKNLLKDCSHQLECDDGM